MEDLNFFYGEPLELDGIGTIYPTTVYELKNDPSLFNVLFLQVNHHSQNTEPEERERRKWIQSNLKNWDIVCSNPMFFFQLIILISQVMKVDLEKIKSNFEMVLAEISNGKEQLSDEDILQIGSCVFVEVSIVKEQLNDEGVLEEVEEIGYISRENYDDFRNEIIRMNALKFPRVGKTKEAQEQFDLEYKVKNKDSNGNYSDMMSTIGVELGKTPEELKKMTLYQAHMYFARINQKYKYETDISFMCAGATDIKVESIGSHIDLFETEELMEKTTMDKFQNKYGKMLTKQA